MDSFCVIFLLLSVKKLARSCYLEIYVLAMLCLYSRKNRQKTNCVLVLPIYSAYWLQYNLIEIIINNKFFLLTKFDNEATVPAWRTRLAFTAFGEVSSLWFSSGIILDVEKNVEPKL